MFSILKYKKKIIGIIGILISMVLIFYFSNFIASFVKYGEKYLSPDNYFDPKTVIIIEEFIIIILFTMTSSIFLFLNLKNKIQVILNSCFQTTKTFKFFLKDAECSKKQLPQYILVIGLLSGFFLHFYLLSTGRQPPYEGTLENYSSWLLLFSTLILIISSLRINRKFYPPKTLKNIMFFLIIISGIFLLLFGEEISWGQHFFSWESPDVFKEYNFQKETNIHNFFNPFYKYIYPIVGMGSFMILFFIWFFPKKKKSYLFNLFFPHPSLFFLAFIMACSSFAGHSEIFEELLAVFSLLYSIRIYMCLSYPSMDLKL